MILGYECTSKTITIICAKYRSNCDQKTVNLDLEGSVQQTTESRPPKDLVLKRNPAYEGSDPQNTIDQEQTRFLRNPIYEETKPHGATAQEQTRQQSTFEPTYDVISHTQDQEEGSQYNVLDRSIDTLIGADTIPAEAEEGSDYSLLQ